MRLIAYELGHPRHDLQPGRQRREWMAATPSGFANRCMPLLIANQHGWELRCRSSFEATWNGNSDVDAVSVRVIEQGAGDVPISHFGSGTLTFHINTLLRTEPGISLVMTGPPNSPKHGISPLTGIIETDWSPMSATMNWRLTAKHCPVRFLVGEPFCFIFPIQRTLIEQTEPEYRPLADDPELAARHAAWTSSRSLFNAELKMPDSAAGKAGWMRDYHRSAERTRLQVRPFRNEEEPEPDSTA